MDYQVLTSRNIIFRVSMPGEGKTAHICIEFFLTLDLNQVAFKFRTHSDGIHSRQANAYVLDLRSFSLLISGI